MIISLESAEDWITIQALSDYPAGRVISPSLLSGR
jgi:hypothetical protein